MKKLKRLTGLIMAVCMIVALTVTASAASITVKAPSSMSVNEIDFSAYRIFDLDVVGTGDDKSYSYTINENFEDFVFSYGGETYSGEALRSYLSGLAKDDAGNISDMGVVMALTGQLKTYIADKGITATATGTGADNEAVINELAAGYYVVIPGAGISAMPILSLLTVDDGNVDITLKADVPTIDKEVQENSNGAWGDKADYNIGDTVPFKLKTAVPTMAGYDSYTFIVHDTMSDGLTFDPDSVEVTVDEVEYTDYTVKTSDLEEGGCTFHIVFDADKFAALTSGDAIEITYNATLNSGAVIGNNGNPNDVYLEYSNDPYSDGTGETPVIRVVVFTYELDVTKVNSEDAKLKDAEFVLYRGSSENIEYAIADDNGKITGWDGTKANAKTFKSDENGLFKIIGLDDDTYYLEETKAPDGYNILENPIKLVIAATFSDSKLEIATLTITVDDAETPTNGSPATGVVAIDVENNAGSLLPSTGGIGKTIFIVIGITLMVGAAVLLVAKKVTAK